MGLTFGANITTIHETITISKFEVDDRLSVDCNYIFKFSILYASCKIEMYLLVFCNLSLVYRIFELT